LLLSPKVSIIISMINFNNIRLLLLLILLLLTGLLGVAIGSTDIPIMQVLGTQLDASQQIIIWMIRIPRVLVAALVGMALAVAGAQMQGLLQNPLASPDIVGTSSGGALGAVIALATGLASQTIWYLPLFTFLGAFMALLIVYLLSTQPGHTQVASLLLAGVALNAFIVAITSLIISLAWTEYEVGREMTFWLMGGLDSRTWSHVWISLPSVIIGTLVALWYSRELDLLMMGPETASALGVNVERVKQMVLINTALLTSTAVAVSGIVGFVGLIIPHGVRLLLGPSHQALIPASALSGASFLILVDLLARTLNRPEEIRLGIFTAALGAPFFLYLLVRHRREVL